MNLLSKLLSEFGIIKVLYIPAKGLYCESSNNPDDLMAKGYLTFFKRSFNFFESSFGNSDFMNSLSIILLSISDSALSHKLFLSMNSSNPDVLITTILGIRTLMFGN